MKKKSFMDKMKQNNIIKLLKQAKQAYLNGDEKQAQKY